MQVTKTCMICVGMPTVWFCLGVICDALECCENKVQQNLWTLIARNGGGDDNGCDIELLKGNIQQTSSPDGTAFSLWAHPTPSGECNYYLHAKTRFICAHWCFISVYKGNRIPKSDHHITKQLCLLLGSVIIQGILWKLLKRNVKHLWAHESNGILVWG